jgi:dynein assembly factor 1
MANEMTQKLLKELCRKDKLYSTPELNDKLFLHYKGFMKIAALDEYTGLRVLWLEGNGISKIEGLTKQAELRTLYLHENLLERLEGLDACVSTITSFSQLVMKYIVISVAFRSSSIHST